MLTFKEHAKRVFAIEAQAIANLKDNLNQDFTDLCEYILTMNGKIVLTGIGKSGIVAKKIASSLASTGSPSIYMHPGDAFHGDLGMIQKEDLVVMVSHSGETEEVTRLIPFVRAAKCQIVALCGEKSSTLVRSSDYFLNVEIQEEACPLKLAPTSSTTAAIAMGDALTIALMEARNLRPQDFAKYHPGQIKGKRLHMCVGDEMVTESLPIVKKQSGMMEVLQAMTQGRLGMVIVAEKEEYGIITEGDLHKVFEALGPESFQKTAGEIMQPNPVILTPSVNVGSAVEFMKDKNISRVLVEEESKIVGVFTLN